MALVGLQNPIKVKMILSEHFLKNLILANKISPTICGQLFSYDATQNCIKILDKPSARHGFKWRGKLFAFIAAEMIFRILDRKLNFTQEVYTENTRVDISMCMLMFLPCLVVAERYRVRSKFPDEFKSFFNGVIQMEKIHGKGNQIQGIKLIQTHKCHFILL